MSRKNIFLVFAFVCIGLLLAASAPAGMRAWILLPDTKVYGEPSTESETLIVLKQNESVALIGETTEVGGVVWQKICYNDAVEGFVPYNLLYFTGSSYTKKVRFAQISPKKMGEEVPLRKTVTGDDVLFLHDGQSVLKVETDIDYGAYSQVEYQGEIYFVQTEFLTEKATLNQKVSIVFIVIAIVIVIAAPVLFVLRRKKGLKK